MCAYEPDSMWINVVYHKGAKETVLYTAMWSSVMLGDLSGSNYFEQDLEIVLLRNVYV